MNKYEIVDGRAYKWHRDGYLMDLPTHRIGDITPLNEEQRIAFDACMDPRFVLKVLVGEVGTGKTGIAVWTGLHRLLRGDFQTLAYTRMPVPKQRTLGLLPGTLEDKHGPWLAAFDDQAELMNVQLDKLVREGRLIMVSLEHIKGRTFRNTLLIVDEAQDLAPETAEAALGRLSDGSEAIFVGDPLQIDEKGLTNERNGLIHLTKLTDEPDVAAVYLTHPVRGRGAELASLLSRMRA